MAGAGMRCLSLLVLATAASGWRLANVERKIDGSKSIVRTTTVVKAVNDGTATDKFTWVVPQSNLSSIAKLKLSQQKSTDGKSFSEIAVEESQRKDGLVYYEATLHDTVAKGGEAVLRARVSQGGALRPLPAMVKQEEAQMFDYNHNVYFLSPYACDRQVTEFITTNGKVNSHTKTPSPVEQEGDSLKFGPYTNVKALSTAPLRVHYQNNSPFIKATKGKKIVEVSMWGNLAVEEWYEIENTGAKLKGTFSRVLYDRMGRRAPSAFTDFVSRLPGGAEDIYFRDDIGNISTSDVHDDGRGKKLVRFQQRFPLFGGWKTRFYYGYNLALEEAMETDGSVNRLRVPYVTTVEHLYIQDYTFEIVLPEGVSNPQLTIGGKPVTDYELGVRQSYLDTTGRTLVTIKDHSLDAKERNEVIEITFQSGSVLREPCLIMGAFMALMLSVIFLGRLVA